MSVDIQTVEWLLESKNPSVRYYALKDLMDEPDASAKLEKESKQIPHGPYAQALFSGEQLDGGFGCPSLFEMAEFTGRTRSWFRIIHKPISNPPYTSSNWLANNSN